MDPSRAKEQARRQFEAWASTYDRSPLHRFLFRPSYMVLVDEVGRWVEERRPATFRALDVGCGTGTVVSLLAGAQWPVHPVGLDYAPSMCVQALRKAMTSGAAERACFVAGDSEHLPFANASFDIITCSNSFHHYPHQQAVVSEMRRLLRPGGRLLVIDGFRDNVIGWFVFDVIIAHVEKDVYHAPWSVIHDYFVKAGFQNIRRRKFNLWFPAVATIGDAI
jgi:ubiquinone/menaquinone biosynthesis C-methylase UbiE